jgi:hypothetical protein
LFATKGISEINKSMILILKNYENSLLVFVLQQVELQANIATELVLDCYSQMDHNSTEALLLAWQLAVSFLQTYQITIGQVVLLVVLLVDPHQRRNRQEGQKLATELVVGIKLELVVGIRLELVVGIRLELVVGIRLELVEHHQTNP